MDLRPFIRRHEVGIVTFAVTVLVVAFAGFFPLLSTDTLCRYAPMAEAFARGEWSEAFHPRFGVGLQTLAGSLCWLTGINGLSACAMMSALAWALTIVPLFRLADFVYDRRAAWVAVILYLICPQILIWGLKGSRETFKLLGLVMTMDAVFRARTTDRRVFWEALAGLACLLLFKVDSIVFAFVFVVLFAIRDRFGRRSAWLCVASAILLQPCCAVVWHWQHWWLPAPQYIKLLTAIFGGHA